MIGYTVIGGYLGAGKTTLLNHILTHNDGLRIALLINDFGAINIDAALIEQQSDSQINLTNGCICCTLTDGFYEAIESLLALDPQPDHIVVEASGVADVHNLAQYGYGAELELNAVIVLADAETVRAKANDKYVAQTVRRQLQHADLILLNKADLLSDAQLADVRDWLATNFPDVPCIETVRANLPMHLLFETPHREASVSPHTHETYRTWSFTSSIPTTMTQAEVFLDNLPANVIRAKGFIALDDGGCLELQAVGARKHLALFSGEEAPSTNLVAIGLSADWTPDALDRLAHALTSDT